MYLSMVKIGNRTRSWKILRPWHAKHLIFTTSRRVISRINDYDDSYDDVTLRNNENGDVTQSGLRHLQQQGRMKFRPIKIKI